MICVACGRKATSSARVNLSLAPQEQVKARAQDDKQHQSGDDQTTQRFILLAQLAEVGRGRHLIFNVFHKELLGWFVGGGGSGLGELEAGGFEDWENGRILLAILHGIVRQGVDYGPLLVNVGGGHLERTQLACVVNIEPAQDDRSEDTQGQHAD